MTLTRRTFLGLLSSSTFFLSAGSLSEQAAKLPGSAPGLRFDQGVASGAPQPDAVMLWTRATPAPTAAGSDPIPVLLQVSRHSDFSDLLVEQVLETASDSDYTLRAFYHDANKAESIRNIQCL